MDPLVTSSAISAGAGLVDNIASIFTKKSDRRYAEKMWHKQNEYNSPTQQMQRLKAAGLNPHLVYGSGSAVGNSASAVQHTEGAQTNFGEVAGNYITNRLNAQQEKNLRKQEQLTDAQILNAEKDIEVKDQNILSSIASTANTEAQTARTQWDYEFAKETKNMALEKMSLGIDQQKSSIGLTNSQIDNAVKDLLVKDQNIKYSRALQSKVTQEITESKQRVENMLIQGQGYKMDNELKRLDINLRKLGINPNDPSYMRILGQVFSKGDTSNFGKLGQNTSDWVDEIKAAGKYWWQKFTK